MQGCRDFVPGFAPQASQITSIPAEAPQNIPTQIAAAPADAVQRMPAAEAAQIIPAPCTAAPGVVQAHNWDRVAEMKATFVSWTLKLIPDMKICGYCGRAAYGGTPYAKTSFKSISVQPGSWPPYAAANMLVHEHCGTM